MILKSFRVQRSFQLLLLHSYRWNLCNWSTFSDSCGKIARHRSFIGAAITVAQQIKSQWRPKVQQMSALFDVQQKNGVRQFSKYSSSVDPNIGRCFLNRTGGKKNRFFSAGRCVQLCNCAWREALHQGATWQDPQLARSATMFLSAYTEAWRGVGL